ncbi:hypothetical protein CAEBREN_16929 [Caenorhabditis brenneri]|uniref:F-box domain-containing protein n=1 Tax=Caenorhabditis brenneri TaxID=135651 RepID=G0N3I0_CAEBE|nr:hypothetical protein CAEBREN_16929 [Caenorhabditis brenneri]
MQVDRFRLRCLPIDVLKNVLRTMDGDQLISYSLISRTTKQNVIDLKIKLRSFAVSIHSKLVISLQIPKYYQISLTFDENKTMNWNPEENEPLSLDTPEIVEAKCSKDYFQGCGESLFLENRGISVREWILHLFDIFRHLMINVLHLSEESNHFDISSIRRMVEGLTVNRIAFHRLPLDSCYKLMGETNTFLTGILLKSDLMPVEYLHKIVIQNTEITMFHSKILSLEERIQFRIDDILANNSENIFSFFTITSYKDMNRFLKLWMKGSNPRLKFMDVGFTFGGKKELLAIMNGIKYRVMEEDERRVRPCPKDLGPIAIAASEGSFLIRRKDGVEATVSIFSRRACMKFAVWD